MVKVFVSVTVAKSPEVNSEIKARLTSLPLLDEELFLEQPQINNSPMTKHAIK
ncbi:hypothetical protein HMPREF3187_00196 [Aerococcus christensenii]|uniref:Uncharacterized protein n=1 Tax=Aerococcus christensenii TaxID=87541 RepID=A0A133Y4I3_9LACT|nr:hypothetical protein HMPREF3187_00196 [Aerococcus christensenii]